MHLVALTRWSAGASLEQELQPLAGALGLGLYDARLKLVAPPPNVLAGGLAPAAAQALLGLLRTRGHGAVSCDAQSLIGPDQMPQVRSVQLSEHALTGIDSNGQPFYLPFSELSATLRAAEQSDQNQTVATKGKQLAIGRALLTGGLLRNKTVTKLQTTESSERQAVGYLFRAAGDPPLLLKEQRINYEGLGSHRGLTSHDSFERLIAHLRKLRPNALHDDRLLTQKRRVDLTGVRGLGVERTISNSNTGTNALAAQLIVLAHREGQL